MATAQPTPGTVTVTGHSDDLVELDGAIRDEVDAYDAVIMLRFDTGVQLRVHYDADGIWRIQDRSLHPGGALIVSAEDRPGWSGPDGEVYSDEATVPGVSNFVWTKL